MKILQENLGGYVFVEGEGEILISNLKLTYYKRENRHIWLSINKTLLMTNVPLNKSNRQTMYLEKNTTKQRKNRQLKYNVYTGSSYKST